MKIFEGIVVSVGMKNTAVVEVFRKTPHPLYRKLIKKSKKIKADTSSFEPVVGNIVRITETRPMSKDKYFKITKILGEAVVKKESIEAIDEVLEEVKPVRKIKADKASSEVAEKTVRKLVKPAAKSKAKKESK